MSTTTQAQRQAQLVAKQKRERANRIRRNEAAAFKTDLRIRKAANRIELPGTWDERQAAAVARHANDTPEQIAMLAAEAASLAASAARGCAP